MTYEAKMQYVVEVDGVEFQSIAIRLNVSANNVHLSVLAGRDLYEAAHGKLCHWKIVVLLEEQEKEVVVLDRECTGAVTVAEDAVRPGAPI